MAPITKNKSIARYLAIGYSLFLIFLAPACIPRTIKSASDSQPGKDPLDWSDWARVLGGCVENDRVNYTKLLRDREALDHFLSLLAESGPRMTPERFKNNDT